MIQVEAGDISTLAVRLGNSYPVIKAAKRAAFEAAAPQLKQAVDSAIGGSGKVAGWQQQRVGSKGGYAAVSPRAKQTHKGYSVGYITNAINSGHRFPSPSGKNPKYRPRIRSGKQRVQGKFFYEAANAKAEGIAQAAAAQVADALKDHLEGK
ncbi:MAG: hypothetical protein IJV74_03820 [Clostridia bacterium]|nr:hypothetical protein [Clostridia bacterium]